ncbi:transcription factor 25-like protein [Chloropicon primus]|uniref:Transcription factor 25-like protein n=2 Tax=Chloropicon primus TaxID=1764295 RepID=A0A5B8MU77_9CHLO|nr:transcription factor 25-like protein [Chloropicon primus]UPR03094.1 transcription factor 25-like protein [Chloropicon primus]|eukprot:QDZ23881.1 transcription factor 25-like protein [Chloropicon primus]
MASRHLRRLQEEREAALRGEESESESEEEEPIGFSGSGMASSAFALLSNSGDDEAESESQEEEEEEAKARDVDSTKQGKKSEKKKKKKKTKGKKTKGKAKDEEDGEEEEDIDALISEFGGSEVTERASTSTRRVAEAHDLLTIEANFLSPEREMRRIFGSGAFSASRERATRQHRLRRINKNKLFEPPANWRKPDSGLGMAHTGNSSDGGLDFEYTWSQDYRDLQRKFDAIAATHDPNNLVEFLRKNPYHLDTLLSLFYIYSHTGDFATADSFLERCIFCLESAFHPWFDVTKGSLRLSYKVEENQMMFQVLFRYIGSLSRRGCHRAALEFSKLLLSFDKSDPMGVLFCIDFHSIRAREYPFLFRMVSEYENGEKNLSLYPNFLYSVAMAKWYHERDPDRDDGEKDTALAETTSAELLSQAIQTYPFGLAKLLKKLSDKGMITMASWEPVLQKPLFKNSSSGNNASLDHLVRLFVEKQYELWKDTEIQTWMLSVAKEVVEAEDADGMAADWRALQKEIWPPSEVNMYRHIIPEDQMGPAQIPQELLQMGGPGAQQEQQAMQQPGLQQTVQLGGDELREGNTLSILLQSLLPWVSVDSTSQPPPPPRAEEEEEEG